MGLVRLSFFENKAAKVVRFLIWVTFAFRESKPETVHLNDLLATT